MHIIKKQTMITQRGYSYMPSLIVIKNPKWQIVIKNPK